MRSGGVGRVSKQPLNTHANTVDRKVGSNCTVLSPWSNSRDIKEPKARTVSIVLITSDMTCSAF
jgi:hypothetical protein